MKAVIFDCDGTLADTERDAHLPAFNATFAELGLPVAWTEQEYGRLLRIGGGKERMATLLTPEFVARHRLPSDPQAQRELLTEWHRRKTAHYRELIASGRVPARPGVRRLADEARARGWRLAVASTSQPAAVQAVLDMAFGQELAGEFELFCGDQAAAKKPAPGIYLLALAALGVDATQAVAIEDSRQGLLAARAAGIPAIVTVSGYTREQDMTGAALVVSDLGEPDAPMTVLRNQAGLRVGGYVRATDLEALLKDQGCATSGVGCDVPAHGAARNVEGEAQPDAIAAERDA